MTPEEQKLVDELLAKGYSEDEIITALLGDTPAESTPTFDDKVAERMAQKSFLEKTGDVVTDIGNRLAEGATFGLSESVARPLAENITRGILGERTPEEQEAMRIEEAAKYKLPSVYGNVAEMAGSFMPANALESGVKLGLTGAAKTLPKFARYLQPVKVGGKVIEPLIGKMLTGGIAGGTQGFLSSFGEEDQRTPTILSAGIGASLPPALAAGSKIFKFLGGMGAKAFPAGKEFLAEELPQQYLKLADKMRILKNKPETMTGVDDGTREALSFLNRALSDEQKTKDLVGSALGVYSKTGPLRTKLAEGFNKNFDLLKKLGIFEYGGTLNSLGKYSKDLMSRGKGLRDNTIKVINEAFFKMNKGAKSIKELKGLITPKDINPYLGDLRQEIARLKLNKKSTGLANAIENELNGLINDLKIKHKIVNGRKVLAAQTPTTVLAMTENLNKVRRLLFKEFNAGNVAKGIEGDVPNYQAIEGSIKAIDEMQEYMMNAIENKLAKPELRTAIKAIQGSKVGEGVPDEFYTVPKDIFRKLNEEYSALRGMDDIINLKKREAANIGSLTYGSPKTEPPGRVGASLGKSGIRFYGGEVIDQLTGTQEGIPGALENLLRAEGITESPEVIKMIMALSGKSLGELPAARSFDYDFTKAAPYARSALINMYDQLRGGE